MLDLNEQHKSALKCLKEFGRDINFPIYTAGTLSRFGCKNFTVKACNLLPEAMLVPVPTEDIKATWESFTVSSFEYHGYVYGLDVETNHNYIADGIITHNCLYRFSGASPEAFLFPPIPEKRIKVLDYSRRLPRKILQFSRRWIEQVAVRQPKEFTGKDEEGAVLSLPASYHYKNPQSIVDLADKYVRQGKTVMILATCSYMLQGVVRELTNAGMPFHNPYRVKRGDWSPLVRKDKIIRRMMSFLSYSLKDGAAARPWTTIDIALWAGAMKVKDGLVKRGAGALLEKWGKMEYPYDVSSAEALLEIFEEDEVIRLVTTEPDIDWWFNQLKSDMQDSAVYPMRILKQYGVNGLVEKPMITVGTVHSVKGGEAKVVIVFQDLSRQGMLEWQGTQEQKDSIRRVMYVAATRAEETLILASPASSICMRWDE